MKFRAEILGKVPQGLTHNDVFATINSVVRDEEEWPTAKVESVTKRRLSSGNVSVIVVLDAETQREAVKVFNDARRSVLGFSADIMIREMP